MPWGPWPGVASGGGTLASIYAFGLGDNPVLDNVFDTPSYQQTFPLSDINANDFAGGLFEKIINGQSNTFVNYWRRKGDHTINTEKVFNILSINDPTWNGSGDTLAPVQTWTAEKIYYGLDPDAERHFTGFQAFLGGRFWTWQDGGTLVYDGTPGRGITLGTGRNLSRDQWGWNHIFATAQQNQRQSGYGWVVNQLAVDTHGVAATHLEQVLYGGSFTALNPGDGMAYMFAVGSLFDLNGTHVKGWFGIRSPDDAEGSADNSSWYASIAASFGSPHDLSIATEVVQFWARGGLGMLLQLGGVQFPNSDSSTFTTSDANSARVIWDDNLKQMMGSIDGTEFAPLSALSGVMSAVVDLTATGVHQLLPPMPYRLFPVTSSFEIKTTNTVTVSPTLSIGSNSPSFNNRSASQTPAGFTTAVAEGLVTPSTITPATCIDLSTSGLQLNITTGATATALTARLILSCVLVPV